MRFAYPPYGPESGLLFHSKFNDPIILAWIRHSIDVGNPVTNISLLLIFMPPQKNLWAKL
uniref:Uncharacterized protein n=1 Tax=Candidatus Kentrum sp. UNK TaxID=2126344 RepID=A0A451AKY1_9GAMM|nr:MAG: hypothetical protein BECKUNK1418G_GA0071005_110314 [Candidatus Kentron sp. UNK]VFK69951.1 MAG: hypothetical protein BECKUNK1418H_GA0071006_102133 [Candidatus Kentron sp. UNK]